MITKFVTAFDDKREALRAEFAKKHPGSYAEIVRLVISQISDGGEYDEPDPDRVHQIDDGDWQGTLVFVIAAGGYQPTDYWSLKIHYGSCSVCDTLQSIQDPYGDEVSPEQVDDYMTLALHIVQGLKEL